MKATRTSAMILTAAAFALKCSAAGTVQTDICVYGATSAGIVAAYTAAKAGKSVVVVEPFRHAGGMTTGGLGFTDIGNKYVVKGVALDFYRRIGEHYGRPEQWIFEPHVASEVFDRYISDASLDIRYSRHITGAQVQEGKIRTITTVNHNSGGDTLIIAADQWIDCSYEGDLMAAAGVSYTTGREPNSLYGEKYNGVQIMKGHQFWDPIDPYIVKGDPTSGLLPGINSTGPAATGSGDNKIQAYNYRICLTDDPANMAPIQKPDNYDPMLYELALRLHEVSPRKSVHDYFIWSPMPNRKTDVNNGGGISTDFIGANWDYPEADWKRRHEIIDRHTDYTKGLLYFLGHDPRVPEKFRHEMLRWGYPLDEYTDNGNFTPQLYIRESRRMVSDLVMNEAHCTGQAVVDDPIAWAAYTMDSHNCDRHVVDGVVKNEGNVEIGGFPPYPIGFGAIVPKADEAVNLTVPVCLSASHIAFGSIRMEPVFMTLAQAAAIASCEAMDNRCPVQDVDFRTICRIFESNPFADGRKPDILMDNAGALLSRGWTVNPDTRCAYGPDFAITDLEANPDAKAWYHVGIDRTDTFDVQVFVPQIANATEKIQVTLFDHNGIHVQTINYSDIEFLGQASGEWVSIGSHALSPGCYIRISGPDGNTPAKGLLTADAIRLRRY